MKSSSFGLPLFRKMTRAGSHIKSWSGKLFVPLTWAGAIYIALLILLIRYYVSTDFDTAFSYTYASFLELICWIIIVIMSAIWAIDLLLFAFSVIYMYWAMSGATERYFRLSLQEEGNRLKITVPFLARPLFGDMDVQVEFDDEHVDARSYPIGSRSASVSIPLDNIREYNISFLDIRITDMFGFFRGRRRWAYHQSIIQYPQSVDGFTFRAQLDRYRKSEDSHHERKVLSPGEWLNFKDFETGDDVKRIIWKIYAKSRTLMVRHRENISFDNSESHVYFSFHIPSPEDFWVNNDTRNYVLDLYKNILWNSVKILKNVDRQVVLHLPSYPAIHASGEFREKIVLQSWMQSKDDDWHITHKGSTLFIPDVMNARVLKDTLDKYASDISGIILIETAYHRPVPAIRRWMKKLFLKSSADTGHTQIKIHSAQVSHNREKILKLLEENKHINLDILSLSPDDE